MDKNKRQILIDQLADLFLNQGLKNTGLRYLAKEAGTSDRMLLHYFKDKEELMTEVLLKISENFIQYLNSLPLEKTSIQELMKSFIIFLNDSTIKLYSGLWLELAALASHNEQPFLQVSQKAMADFLKWVDSKIALDDEILRETLSSFLIVMTEGFTFLNSLKREDIILKSLFFIEQIFNTTLKSPNENSEKV